MLRTLFLALVATIPLPAQSPSGHTLPAEEANVVVLVDALFAEISAAMRPAAPAPSAAGPERAALDLAAFDARTVGPTTWEIGDYRCVVHVDEQLSHFVVIAAPFRAGTPSTRIFARASEGQLLVCEDHERRYAGSEALPPATIAVEAGSDGDLAEALRIPGKGQEGHHWTVLDPRLYRRAEVELRAPRDEASDSDVELVVVLGAREGGRSSGLTLPAANLRSTGSGSTLVAHGPAVAEATVAVRASRNGRCTPVPPDLFLVRAQGGKLVVELSPDWEAWVRIAGCEAEVVSTLRNIASAQAQCQAMGIIDTNGNGAGEYGFFAELAGKVAVRSAPGGVLGKDRITPPVLSATLGNVVGGRVQRDGYWYRMYLPGEDEGRPAVPEAEAGGSVGVAVHPALAEVLWMCIAWPVEAGRTGRRVFVLTQSGDLLAAPNAEGRWSGDVEPEPFGFAPTDAEAGWYADPPLDRPARDGQRWVVVR